MNGVLINGEAPNRDRIHPYFETSVSVLPREESERRRQVVARVRTGSDSLIDASSWGRRSVGMATGVQNGGGDQPSDHYGCQWTLQVGAVSDGPPFGKQYRNQDTLDTNPER